MPNVAVAESLPIEVGYENLSPAIHSAADRLTSQIGGGLMRIDGVNESDLELLRHIFKANEGESLPAFFNSETGYRQGGKTCPVEARHAEFKIVSSEFNQRHGFNSVFVDLPAYAAEVPARDAEGAEPETPQEAYRPSKKLLATIATAGAVEYASMMEGISSGNKLALGAFATSLTVALAGIVRIVSKA